MSDQSVLGCDECGHALDAHDSVTGCERFGCRCARFKSVNVSPSPEQVSGITATQAAISEECDALKALLLEKNRAYGDSAVNPLRIFSKASPEEQINVRLDDKLSRLARGSAAGEDVELDLMGYLILKRVSRKLRGK